MTDRPAMTDTPEARAREVLLDALSDDPMIEQIRKGIVQPHHVGWDQAIAAVSLAFASTNAGEGESGDTHETVCRTIEEFGQIEADDHTGLLDGPEVEKLAAAILAALAAKPLSAGPLLRGPTARAPTGCHCRGTCGAPVIMGRQQPCRRPGGIPGQPVPPTAPAIEREGVSREWLVPVDVAARQAMGLYYELTGSKSMAADVRGDDWERGASDSERTLIAVLKTAIDTARQEYAALSPASPTIERDEDDLRHKLWMIVSHATGGNCPTIEGIDRSTNDICCDISRFRNILYQDGKDVGKRKAYKRAAWPRLTNAMIDAACVAHYGKNRVSAAGGADGVDMAVDSHDYSFRQAFRRMWPAMKRAALIPGGDDREPKK